MSNCPLDNIPRDYFAGGGLLSETREEKKILADILNDIINCANDLNEGGGVGFDVDKILTARPNGQILVSRNTGNVLLSR